MRFGLCLIGLGSLMILVAIATIAGGWGLIGIVLIIWGREHRIRARARARRTRRGGYIV